MIVARCVYISSQRGQAILCVKGLKKILDVIGRDINDKNWREPAVWAWIMLDEESEDEVEVRFHICGSGYEVQDHWVYLNSIFLDEGRRVNAVFYEQFTCATGIMR